MINRECRYDKKNQIQTQYRLHDTLKIVMLVLAGVENKTILNHHFYVIDLDCTLRNSRNLIWKVDTEKMLVHVINLWLTQFDALEILIIFSFAKWDLIALIHIS